LFYTMRPLPLRTIESFEPWIGLLLIITYMHSLVVCFYSFVQQTFLELSYTRHFILTDLGCKVPSSFLLLKCSACLHAIANVLLPKSVIKSRWNDDTSLIACV
jgi:hypothetical protein